MNLCQINKILNIFKLTCGSWNCRLINFQVSYDEEGCYSKDDYFNQDNKYELYLQVILSRQSPLNSLTVFAQFSKYISLCVIIIGCCGLFGNITAVFVLSRWEKKNFLTFSPFPSKWQPIHWIVMRLASLFQIRKLHSS